MFLIDTHCHINFKAFEKDRDEVIKRTITKDIWMINVGSQYANSKKAVEISEKYPAGVYAAVGLHPTDAKDEEFDWAKFEKLTKNEKVIAIGECGLDYYRSQKNQNLKISAEGGFVSGRKKQKDVFVKHLELAFKLKKPLIIHCREAHNDLIDILNSKSHILNSIPGVMHFFTGTAEQAQKYLELGFYISFSGVITFVSDYNELVKKIPLEKILAETDSPYVAPAPYRGKRNEPIYVEEVVKKIAEIKNISFEKVAEQTKENAKRLFRIPIKM